jgi:uncharacterized protein
MLLKILGFAVVVFLIYIFFFKNKRKDEIEKSKESHKKLEGDTMVECKQCTTFVSHDEAIIKDGCFFCSKECAGVLK